MYKNTPILVMGAGIQGSCTALELARRGYRVTLLDQDNRPMNRASLRNEGKIHLGFVYANDPSMATATLQLDGALSFWPLLGKWAKPRCPELVVSTPFYYLVPTDSLRTPDELLGHYKRLERLYTERISADPDLNYLGRRPDRLVKNLRSSALRKYFNLETVLTGFHTEERSIITEQLAGLLRAAIDESPNIVFHPGRKVTTLARDHGSICVAGISSRGDWQLTADQVVNATWEGRLALDHQMGLKAEGWLHRLKYRVIAQLPSELSQAPSVTMVLGRYGDVVIRPDNTAYLSWYPVALRGWSHAPIPPESWQEPCQGFVSDTEFNRIAEDTLRAIDSWYPGIARCHPLKVDAGVIVAFGKTDVDDPASGLHQRDQVGITSVDGYHSLDAGKLTTAPMFAQLAADRVDAY